MQFSVFNSVLNGWLGEVEGLEGGVGWKGWKGGLEGGLVEGGG